MVVGVIAQGTSMSLTADWSQPLADTNLSSQEGLEKASGVAQIQSGATSVTTYSTTQVWNGTKPLTFNLTLDFFAIDDAVQQVMKPLMWLQKFISPNVKGVVPFDITAIGTAGSNSTGRIPERVSIDIGRKIIVPVCVIESVSIPIDKERDSKGNLIRAQVTVGCQTLAMLNNNHFDGIYK